MELLYDGLTQRIALSQMRGMRAPVVRELISRIDGVDNFFRYSQQMLTSLTGVRNEVFSESARRAALAAAQKEREFVDKNNISTYFICDDDYPERLSGCDDAPVMLFKMGRCSLRGQKIVGVVGTRHSTSYGLGFTKQLVNDLADKFSDLLIISGLAYGIDVAAHKAALDRGVPTVGVLAHGLNMIYPADHRAVAARMVTEGGGLVTEYTTATRIHRGNFLERNRIVAGLCDALVVVESDIRGGSMSTARIANLYSRDVFAVPGRVNDIYSRGTNRLIMLDMARLVTDASDVIEYMGWKPTAEVKQEPPQLFYTLSDEEQQILDFIKENPDATVNDMCVRLDMKYGALCSMLFKLELEDIIVSLPGGRYACAIRGSAR